MYKGVIFDMDGVLVDSEPWYFQVNVEVLGRRGIAIDRRDFIRYAGMGMTTMWADLKQRYGLPDAVEDLVEAEAEGFFRFLQAQATLPAIPGVRELLEALHARDLPIGLASSSARRNVECVLGKTGLRPFFQVVVAGEDVVHGKPAPDIFLRAASLLGSPPETTVVIEDSGNGVRAAKAAGMFCVGFRNPQSGDQDLSPADLVIASFAAPQRAQILGLFSTEARSGRQ